MSAVERPVIPAKMELVQRAEVSQAFLAYVTQEACDRVFCSPYDFTSIANLLIRLGVQGDEHNPQVFQWAGIRFQAVPRWPQGFFALYTPPPPPA